MIEGIDFTSLPVHDMAKAIAFYRDTLGLPLTLVDGDSYAEFAIGNGTLALSLSDTAPSATGTVSLRVPDVRAEVERLKAKGVTISEPIEDSGVCCSVPFHDPTGNRLLIHHRYAPEAAA